MAILKIRDENGKFIEIPSIKGEKGDKGDTGYTLTNTVSGENVTINDALEEKISSLEIDGKSVQNGTPTPDTPIEIESVGTYNEETGKYGVEVETVGKNLFDSENWYETLNTIKSESIQKEIVNGIEYYKFRADAIYDYQYMKGQFKENTQYIITAKARQYDIADQTSTGFVIYYTDGTKNYQYVNRTLEEYDYTLISEINKTIDFISLGYAYNNYVLMRDIMLVEGTDIADYKSYQSNTLVIALNEPLRSLPNGVKDTYENGVITRRIGRVVLDGSEDYSIFSYGTSHQNTTMFSSRVLAALIKKTDGTKANDMYTDKFKLLSNTVATLNTDDNWFMHDTESKVYFCVENSIASTVDEFKTWLSNNNVEVIYELATPTTETVEMPVINTFEGTNNIDVNSGISTTFNVTYTQDIRKIVDEYTTEEEVQNLINEALGIINTELASLTEVSE